jgi:hypothetical protein
MVGKQTERVQTATRSVLIEQALSQGLQFTAIWRYGMFTHKYNSLADPS